MNALLDFTNAYGFPLLFVGQLILAMAVLYLQTKFAPKSVEKDISILSRKVSEIDTRLDKRISLVEVKLENIPELEDLHSLERQIGELRGDLKRVDENLDGTEGIIKRLERQVNRMDTFLKGQP